MSTGQIDENVPEHGPGNRDIIEALLFATDEPLTVRQVIDIFGDLGEGAKPVTVTPDDVLGFIEELNRDYGQTGRAVRIVKVAGGYQFATKPEFASWLGRMLREKSKRKLSLSALETLAVIAYKQPVTKPEIETIRGVNADYVLHTLLQRSLVAIVGRAATPGRPLLYGTTKEFLKHFGVNDLSELPKPREIDELMAEAEFEVEKRMLQELEAKRRPETGDETGPGTGDETGDEKAQDDAVGETP
jgi:segregation and condensation protein B